MTMKRTVWMKVSKDELELPEAVADTARELAEITGTTTFSIVSSVSKVRCGERKMCRYVKVDIEDDEE